MKKLFAVLALVCASALATAQSVQQNGGIDPFGNSYFGASQSVYVEKALYTNGFTVGLAAGAASAPSGSPFYTSGTVAAGSNYGKCVAVDWTGNVSAPSAESSVVTTSAAGSILWTCSPVANAAYYQVWVGSSSNGEANYFVTPANSNTFTQTLPIASGTSATINIVGTSGVGVTFNGGIVNATNPLRDKTRFILAANMTAATGTVGIGTTGTGNSAFSWPVASANWYDLQCKLPTTFAASATIKFQLYATNSSASTISFVNSESFGNTASAAAFQDLLTQGGTSLAASTTPTTGAPGTNVTEPLTVDFQFLSSAAGTVGIEFIGNGTNNVTLLEGGECGLTQTN